MGEIAPSTKYKGEPETVSVDPPIKPKGLMDPVRNYLRQCSEFELLPSEQEEALSKEISRKRADFSRSLFNNPYALERMVQIFREASTPSKKAKYEERHTLHDVFYQTEDDSEEDAPKSRYGNIPEELPDHISQLERALTNIRPYVRTLADNDQSDAKTVATHHEKAIAHVKGAYSLLRSLPLRVELLLEIYNGMAQRYRDLDKQKAELAGYEGRPLTEAETHERSTIYKELQKTSMPLCSVLRYNEGNVYENAKRNAALVSGRVNSFSTTKNRLVSSNLLFVPVIAKGYLNRGLSFDDLIQEGNMGLIRAVDTFDPRLGYAFRTYAGRWVHKSIGRAIRSQCKTVRIPEHKYTQITKMRAEIAKLSQELGRKPSNREIANWLLDNLDLDHLTHDDAVATTQVSLDNDSLGREGETILENIVDPKTMALRDTPSSRYLSVDMEAEKREFTRRFRGKLTAKEQYVISKRGGFNPKTFEPRKPLPSEKVAPGYTRKFKPANTESVRRQAIDIQTDNALEKLEFPTGLDGIKILRKLAPLFYQSEN